jgi:hypothetical protein
MNQSRDIIHYYYPSLKTMLSTIQALDSARVTMETSYDSATEVVMTVENVTLPLFKDILFPSGAGLQE